MYLKSSILFFLAVASTGEAKTFTCSAQDLGVSGNSEPLPLGHRVIVDSNVPDESSITINESLLATCKGANGGGGLECKMISHNEVVATASADDACNHLRITHLIEGRVYAVTCMTK